MVLFLPSPFSSPLNTSPALNLCRACSEDTILSLAVLYAHILPIKKCFDPYRWQQVLFFSSVNPINFKSASGHKLNAHFSVYIANLLCLGNEINQRSHKKTLNNKSCAPSKSLDLYDMKIVLGYISQRARNNIGGLLFFFFNLRYLSAVSYLSELFSRLFSFV